MEPRDLVKTDELHPCQRCGACCAAYRVSFYWAEADDAPGGVVPVQLTQTLSPHLRCMQGTSANQPRCVALDGVVGQSVGCQIYLQRPSPCHELALGDQQCVQARARYGLPPP